MTEFHNYADDPVYRPVKVREIIDAIEKNGLKQIKGYFLEYEGFGRSDKSLAPPHVLIGACAIGQAAVHLEADALSIYDQLNEIDTHPRIGDELASWNDASFTCPQIAKLARERFSIFLERTIYIHIDFYPLYKEKPVT